VDGEPGYELIAGEGRAPIKAWTRGVAVEAMALRQLQNAASLPFIYRWVAAMPDVHWGIGAAVGTVIPTVGAVVPAAVGVDIGCGMMATGPRSRPATRRAWVGSLGHRGPCPTASPSRVGTEARGALRAAAAETAWSTLEPRFAGSAKHPPIGRSNTVTRLGTLGERQPLHRGLPRRADRVWLLLHSGSGWAMIGRHFTSWSERMRGLIANLPDKDPAYSEGTAH
jgi:tRNA-splicing ligase RtcB